MSTVLSVYKIEILIESIHAIARGYLLVRSKWLGPRRQETRTCKVQYPRASFYPAEVIRRGSSWFGTSGLHDTQSAGTELLPWCEGSALTRSSIREPDRWRFDGKVGPLRSL